MPSYHHNYTYEKLRSAKLVDTENGDACQNGINNRFKRNEWCNFPHSNIKLRYSVLPSAYPNGMITDHQARSQGGGGVGGSDDLPPPSCLSLRFCSTL